MDDVTVEDYVDGYDFRFEDGSSHILTEDERALLIDFAYGWVADMEEGLPVPTTQRRER